MGGEQRGHLLLDGLHLGTVFALGKIEKDTADLFEQLAAVLIGKNGVLESRGVGIIDDGIDFGLLASHTLLEGWHIVLGMDAREVGDVVRGVPLRKEGVVHGWGVFVFAAGNHQESQRGN